MVFQYCPTPCQNSKFINIAISIQTSRMLNKRITQNLCTHGYCETYFTHLPVALLSSVTCELAPLRNVLLCVFLTYFYFFTSLFICVSSAMIMYDKRTLLDIGQRYTNLIQDTLSTCNGCMPVRAVCKPHSPDLKKRRSSD